MVPISPLLKPISNVICANANRIGSSFDIYPIKLTMAVTFKCNLRCKMCGIWRIYSECPEKIYSELSLDNYYSIFDQLNFDRLLYLEFTGGEVFLRDDIDRLLIEAGKRIDSLKMVVITTNGYNHDGVIHKIRNILDNLSVKVRFVVGVSIDGVPQVHDFLRGKDNAFKNGFDTYSSLVDLASDRMNLIPHISYTINSYNAGRFEDFFSHVNDLIGVSINDISISVEHEGALYNNEGIESVISKEAVLKDLRYYGSILPLKTGFDLIGGVRSAFYGVYMDGLKKRLNNELIFNCGASKLSAYLDPYGNLYSCTMWDRFIGNLMKDSFSSIWFSKVNEEIRDDIRLGLCRRCWTPCELQPSMLISMPQLLFSVR